MKCSNWEWGKGSSWELKMGRGAARIVSWKVEKEISELKSM